MSSSVDFFAKGQELRERGEPFATATVVRAEKPTSGKPGDKAIITAGGELWGWIGGSCAEPTVIAEALKALAENRSRLIRLSAAAAPGSERDGLTDLPMTCYSGGTMEIYVEPHQPPTRLLIVGGQHVARALARLGRAMGYEIVSAVTAEEKHPIVEADHRVDDLESLGDHVTPRTYVVVATHGHYDEVALLPALRSGAPYVGLVASRKRAASVVDYLRAQGLGERELAALHVPAGLDIQARRGEEIALSIVAEIVQIRRALERRQEAPAASAEPAVDPAPGPGRLDEAVDPVCGMTVRKAGAAHTHQLHGETYYFCGAGCRSRFAAQPESFLQARG
jgi:xanthine dehydrogenase accessory factor